MSRALEAFGIHYALLANRYRDDQCADCRLQEIDSTVGIMRDNINKVSERGERLDSLQDKTDNLATSAQGFRRGANRVRKQMWWKDMKMRMCIIAGVIILIIIVIVVPSMSSHPTCLFSSVVSASNRLTPTVVATTR